MWFYPEQSFSSYRHFRQVALISHLSLSLPTPFPVPPYTFESQSAGVMFWSRLHLGPQGTVEKWCFKNLEQVNKRDGSLCSKSKPGLSNNSKTARNWDTVKHYITRTPLFIPSANISCLTLYKHGAEFPSSHIFEGACYHHWLIWKAILIVSAAPFSHSLTPDAFLGESSLFKSPGFSLKPLR